MTNEETKAKIDSLREQMESCKKEIDNLQKRACTHDEYELCNYSWRPGNYRIKKFCKHCGILLGDPTFEEGREFDKAQGFFTKEFMLPGDENPMIIIYPTK